MLVLAAVGPVTTGYRIMLFIHIIAVVVAFAPLWLTPVLLRLTAAGDKDAADALDISILRFSLPGLAVAGIIGCGLVGMSKKAFAFADPWVSTAVILWIILMAVLAVVARPAIKAFRDGDASARGRVMMATGIGHLILLVMVFLMIFKPGS
ncbi:MAG: hypothetical protein F2520_10695 [Actinobacteria bacterium]|uniref:Unannotated protein n=1 Tax=freshwater metagenome TaxID=449393 RepID=A0A6J5YF07_9ZZZZ|nr:hypothetical protein [Actinomycetota bacterium]MTA78719.1 hypothetical protein [Actinomycetota bacterium]